MLALALEFPFVYTQLKIMEWRQQHIKDFAEREMKEEMGGIVA